MTVELNELEIKQVSASLRATISNIELGYSSNVSEERYLLLKKVYNKLNK